MAAAGAIALTLSLLTGCGSSSNASGPDGGGANTTAVPAIPLPADVTQRAACSLVTQAEIESALGVKVLAGKEEAQPGRSSCGFALASAADQLVLITSVSSTGVPATFEAARARAVSPQAISAGEQAFVTGPQALVRKGTTMVFVLVVVRQPAGQLVAVATKVAQAVGTHL